MEKTPRYVEEVQALLAHLDTNDNQDNQPLATDTPDQVIDMYIEDFAEEERITLIRKKPSSMEVSREEEESDLADLDTAPLATRPQPQPVANATIGVLLLGMFVPLLCIAVQLYVMLNPYTITVTLYTRSQQESLQGTLQMGRVINPLTLSQWAIAQTTGHGHQDAKQATGYITFLNGQFNQVTVPAGTTFTGKSEEQIVTDQDAVIPAASPNPPSLGQVTVPAHAINAGSSGNIQALDINATVSSTLFVKNLSAFAGGQDERDFRTVAPSDITNTANPLKTTLDQSTQSTLAGQLKSGEALTSPTCTTTTTADHQAGQEATQVKVTVSETCNGIAYNTKALTSEVTQLLTAQTRTKLGAGYSMLDVPQVQVIRAAAQNTKVIFSFKAQSTWVYALVPQQQQAIKKLIAGKNTDIALQLLSRLPGIERISLQSSGFADSSRIPKDISSIHLAIFYGL